MPKVFISYRREDSAPQAGRLFDRLARAFGAQNVFRDLDRIGQGLDFVRVIDEQLKECDCALVVIGRNWLTCTDAQGQRRLDDPEDFVSREIAGALQRQILTIPILVDGAKMPKASELPTSINALANRNAVEVLENRYEDDVARLIETINEGGRGGAPTTLAERLRDLRHRIRASRVATVWALAVAFMAFFLGWMRLFDFFTLDTRIESYTLALAAPQAALAAAAPVTIVAIDEASERAMGREFGRSWRGEHAALVDRLVAAGVNSVAFDLWFGEADAADKQLAEAFARARAKGTRVIIGARDPFTASARAYGADADIALLCIGNRLGYASIAPLGVQRGGDARAALATLAAYPGQRLLEVNAAGKELLLQGNAGVTHVRAAQVDRLKHPQQSCHGLRRGDLVAEMLIPLSPLARWRSAPQRYSYHEVMRMSAADAQQRFAGKIVLVGVQKANQDVFRVRGNEERFGVELHADVITALKNGVVIRPASDAVQLIIVLAMGALGSFLALRIGRYAFPLRLVIVLAVAGLYILLCIWVCMQAKVLLNYLYHLVAFGVSYLGMQYLIRRWAT